MFQTVDNGPPPTGLLRCTPPRRFSSGPPGPGPQIPLAIPPMTTPAHRRNKPVPEPPSVRLRTLLQAMKTEEEPHPGRRTGQVFPVSPFAPLAYALLLAGATASVFLAGKPQEGALGVFLVCAGAAMIICPPRLKVEWRLWIVAAALVGCASLAFLPAHWLPEPAWRRTLEATPPIVLPGTISTAPALTFFWLTLLAISLLVGLFLLAQPIRARWLLAFTLMAALAAGTYAAMAIYAKQTGWAYPYAAEASFGFFPNRNHTATFLFVGSLLALGVLGTVLRDGRWLAGTLAGGVVAVCVAGLAFYSPSRGGIVFLLAGVVLWIGGLGQRNRDPRLIISFTAVLLASAIMFLVSGGEVRDRLLGATPTPSADATPAPVSDAPTAPRPDAAAPGAVPGDTMHNLPADARLKIYRDASGIVRDFPVTGTGLGTFALVFPQYRHESISEAIVIHPESDWLLLATEAGIPAVLCLLALLVLAAARLRPEREHPYWPLRWGCAVAVAAAALHGLVDVPVHRAPLGWWLLVVAGLALQSARTAPDGRSRAQHALFVGGGVVALVLGLQLVRAQWFGGKPLPPFSFVAAQDKFFRMFQPNPEEAIHLARQTIREHPMESEGYLTLGQGLFMFEDTDAQVDAAFLAQRRLDPISTTATLWQGDTWSPQDPARAASLWLNSLARRTRNFEAGDPAEGTPAYFFGALVYRASKRPEVQRELWSAVSRGPEFAFAWLQYATPELAREGIGRLSADENFLHRLNATGQRRFLRVWYTRGDRDALTAFLDGRTDWQAAAWPVRLRRLVDAKQYEAAVHEAAGHYNMSLTLPEPVAGTGPAPALSDDQETGDPAGAFTAYWKAGNSKAAQRVLDQALGSAAPPATQRAELGRLNVALAMHDADWPTAWQRLEQEINAEHPGEIF